MGIEQLNERAIPEPDQRQASPALRRVALATAGFMVTGLAACGIPERLGFGSDDKTSTPVASAPETTAQSVPPSDMPEPSVSTSPTPSVSPSTPSQPQYKESQPDTRWQYQTNHSEWNDKWQLRRWWLQTPWLEGTHQVMIGFGCNDSKYYSPNPNCPDGEGQKAGKKQGVHHGLDIAAQCGTEILWGNKNPGVVMSDSDPGSPGSAYGSKVFRITAYISDGSQKDFLFGHVQTVFVEPGQTVKYGEKIAEVGDLGVEKEDGCHPHFELRTHNGSSASAVDPTEELQFKKMALYQKN